MKKRNLTMCQIPCLWWARRAWIKRITISRLLKYLQLYKMKAAQVIRIATHLLRFRKMIRRNKKMILTIFSATLLMKTPSRAKVPMRTFRETKFKRSKMRTRMGRMIQVKEALAVSKSKKKWRAVCKRPKLKNLNLNKELVLYLWCKVGIQKKSRKLLWFYLHNHLKIRVETRPNSKSRRIYQTPVRIM